MNMMRFILAAICLVAFGGKAMAEVKINTTAKQAIIVDYETGTVLYEKNADMRMPTSSMSKVVTMYLVFEALKKGSLSLDGTLPVSERAWRKGGSKMFVKVGDQARVEDLIRGVIIQSGNDATIVLAEGLGGTEEAFAAALTRKARSLGMGNSNFVNASGWPDDNHYSTARDLSVLARAMIDEFPDYYKYYGEKQFTYAGIKQDNRNPLLYKNIGADGLKTGHTEDGGYGLIGTGVRDGSRVIMVLNGMQSKKERADESTRLLSLALSAFRTVKLFEQKKKIDQIPVLLGEKVSVGVHAQNATALVIPRLNEGDLKIDLNYDSPVKAPIVKGQVLGAAKVRLGEKILFETPLVASEDVVEMGFLAKLIAKSRLLITKQAQFQ